MAKRRGSELNHDNWDQEDEKEDPGTFTAVDKAELSTRVIRKAKRSLPHVEEKASSSPFSAFQGFLKPGNSSPFTFKPNDSASTFPQKDSKNNGLVSSKSSEDKSNDRNSPAGDKLHSGEESRSDARPKEYFLQLKTLNDSVLKWMQLHLAKNPYCDFTPVFKDYETHLHRLERTYPMPLMSEKKTLPSGETTFKMPCPLKKFAESKPTKAFFNLGSSTKKEEDSEMHYGANFASCTTNTSTFSFRKETNASTTTDSKSGPTSSSRAKDVEETNETSDFSFQKTGSNNNSAKPEGETASVVPKSSSTSTTAPENVGEEEEYAPPKNDGATVVEEDAFYSKKCKLFLRIDGSYRDNGICMLHLKKLDDKTQLVIRADTSLGNILLNILLSSSFPIERTGKNNVMIVCVPNPPLDSKKADSKEAIPFLIRVKTSEEADELYAKLNEYKS